MVTSNHNPDRIYISIDQHRLGDFNTYLFCSDDMGLTWKKITNGLESYVHCIKEDAANPNLLFAGTERGIFVSFNRGENWSSLNLGIPSLPVREIQIHPEENDLIIATHGRGIYILDDISWMKDISNIDRPKLFNVRHTYRYIPVSDRSTQGNKIYIAPNPSYGAFINYYIPDGYNAKNLSFVISKEDGTLIRKLHANNKPGVHRNSWDLGEDLALIDNRIKKDRYIGRLKLPPGKYIVSMIEDKNIIDKKEINVLPDPRLKKVSIEETNTCYETVHKMAICMNNLQNTLGEMNEVKGKLNKEFNEKKAARLSNEIDELRSRIIPFRMSPDGPNILSRMNWLFNQVGENSGAPTISQEEWINKLLKEAENVMQNWKNFLSKIHKNKV